jgi:hypothetical protein
LQRGPSSHPRRCALEFDGTEPIDDVIVALTTKVAQVDVTVTGTSAAGIHGGSKL